MNGQATLELKNECFYVAGVLNFESVASLWNVSLPLLPSCSSLSFDFSSVTASNSAALALLLEWMKYAKLKKKMIRFSHLPTQLISIANAAGLTIADCSVLSNA